MEEILVIASSCDEDRPIERIDASRRTQFLMWVEKIFDTFPVVSMCFTTSKFQALLQSSEFLTLASQVGSLDEGEGRPFRSIEVGMSRDLVPLISILIHHNSWDAIKASFCCYIIAALLPHFCCL